MYSWKFDLPNAKDQPDHGIKFLRAGAVAINFMSWSRMHPIVGQTFNIIIFRGDDFMET